MKVKEVIKNLRLDFDKNFGNNMEIITNIKNIKSEDILQTIVEVYGVNTRILKRCLKNFQKIMDRNLIRELIIKDKFKLVPKEFKNAQCLYNEDIKTLIEQGKIEETGLTICDLLDEHWFDYYECKPELLKLHRFKGKECAQNLKDLRDFVKNPLSAHQFGDLIDEKMVKELKILKERGENWRKLRKEKKGSITL